jgi:hypothetical protein
MMLKALASNGDAARRKVVQRMVEMMRWRRCDGEDAVRIDEMLW